MMLAGLAEMDVGSPFADVLTDPRPSMPFRRPKDAQRILVLDGRVGGITLWAQKPCLCMG